METVSIIKICEIYGGIFLPPTCKMNYVTMRDYYAHMRLFYVNMQHTYVEMQHDYVNRGVGKYLTLGRRKTDIFRGMGVLKHVFYLILKISARIFMIFLIILIHNIKTPD